MVTVKTGNKNTMKKKYNIFIVDDHPIVRQGLTQLIDQEDDMRICGDAGDALSARNAIPQLQPDAVIIDISLGDESGLKLIEDLARQYPDISILALSMHDEFLYGERALKAGAKGYIMKQESPENILEALRKVTRGNMYMSDRLRSELINKLFSNEGSRAFNSPLSALSNRELEVFQNIGLGLKTQQIAEKLRLSVKTIETHIEHIKRKLGFKNLHELITYAIRWHVTENVNPADD